MKNLLRVLMISVFTLVIGACSKADQDQSTSTPLATAPTSQASAPPTGPAYATPARLSSCTQGAVVTLKWDIRAIQPLATEVEVMTGLAPNETLFAVGGPADEATTGAWARPGTSFTLRDKASGQELTRVIIEGPDCPNG